MAIVDGVVDLFVVIETGGLVAQIPHLAPSDYVFGLFSKGLIFF
jgi:hypothetical protein